MSFMQVVKVSTSRVELAWFISPYATPADILGCVRFHMPAIAVSMTTFTALCTPLNGSQLSP